MLFQNFKKYKKNTALISSLSKIVTYGDIDVQYQFVKKKSQKEV